MSLIGFVCPSCRTGRPSPATTCPICGWTETSAERREPSVLPLPLAPAIQLTGDDHRRLSELASKTEYFSAKVSHFLSSELGRASICDADDITPDVATMNSRLLFRLDSVAGMHARILSYPETYIANGQFISIMSPLGVALIGLREGDRMPFMDLQGKQCSIQLASVMFQPEANRRRQSDQGEAVDSRSVRKGPKRPLRRSARILPISARRRAASVARNDDPGPDNAA